MIFSPIAKNNGTEVFNKSTIRRNTLYPAAPPIEGFRITVDQQEGVYQRVTMNNEARIRNNVGFINAPVPLNFHFLNETESISAANPTKSIVKTVVFISRRKTNVNIAISAFFLPGL